MSLSTAAPVRPAIDALSADEEVGDLVYRGVPPSDPQESQGASERVVVETLDGRSLGELPHVVRHSPDGFAWGYHGSAPADLARSLLVHALGDAARCSVCAGTGRVVWPSLTATEPVPFDPTNELHVAVAAWDPSSGEEIPGANDATRSAVVDSCLDCDGSGIRPLPYQQFKLEVVAGWPMDGPWAMLRSSVLAWCHRNGVTA